MRQALRFCIVMLGLLGTSACASAPERQGATSGNADLTKRLSEANAEASSLAPMVVDGNDAVAKQIEKHWFVTEAESQTDITVELRLTLAETGDVTNVEWLDQSSDPARIAFAERAKRAIKQASPLKMPDGQYWPTIKMRFRSQ